jgi:4-carboxymuconolactone decarboxylase
MSERFERGRALMRQLLGPDFSLGMEEAAASEVFGGEVGRLAIEQVFGDIWSRPGLEHKLRSVAVISCLVTARAQSELKNHLRLGLDNGLTSSEVQEILIQLIPYVGYPAVSHALVAAIEVLRERGLAGSTETAKERGLL